MATKIKFEVVPKPFVNYVEVADTYQKQHMGTQPNFGLIDQEEVDGMKSWQRFTQHVQGLNRDSPDNVQYKILFLTRHALGIHNEAETRFGTQAWDDHWAQLDGDGTVIWADAELSSTGEEHAAELGKTWEKAVQQDGVPLPEVIYTSPLRRCLKTSRIVFSEVFKNAGVPFSPIVKEFLREDLTNHTCDRRSSKTWIEQNYPEVRVEEGFAEEDQLWGPDYFETREQDAVRKRVVLEQIFGPGQKTTQIVSLVVHSGVISTILMVLDAEHFYVREGSTVALLVRAETEAADAN